MPRRRDRVEPPVAEPQAPSRTEEPTEEPAEVERSRRSRQKRREPPVPAKRPEVMEVKRPPVKRGEAAVRAAVLRRLHAAAAGVCWPRRNTGMRPCRRRWSRSKAAELEKLLGEFNVNARVVAAETGPVITMFELELAAGVKVSQISSLANDIARALGAGAVRVVAPIPGKHTIGIEVPNSEKEKVRMKQLMQLAGDKPAKMEIPLFLGKDASGEALVADLAKMPHLLIAGTTGSGKSVCINTIIVGILLTKRPDEVKLILVDPKMVEMTAFNAVPHLMCPIVTETQMAVQILEWATVKMDERYALLAEAGVKNIAEYNKLGTEEIIDRFEPSTPEEEAKIPKKLPYIVDHHRRAGRPDDDRRQGGRSLHRPPGPEEPRRRHPHHPGDAAAAGDGRHRPDQVEHAVPRSASAWRPAWTAASSSTRTAPRPCWARATCSSSSPAPAS